MTIDNQIALHHARAAKELKQMKMAKQKITEGQLIGKVIQIEGRVNQSFLVLDAYFGYEQGNKSLPVIAGKVVRCTKAGKQLKTAKTEKQILEFLY